MLDSLLDSANRGWLIGYVIGVVVVLVVVALVLPILFLAGSIGNEAKMINDSLTQSVHNTAALKTSPRPSTTPRSSWPGSPAVAPG